VHSQAWSHEVTGFDADAFAAVWGRVLIQTPKINTESNWSATADNYAAMWRAALEEYPPARDNLALAARRVVEIHHAITVLVAAQALEASEAAFSDGVLPSDDVLDDLRKVETLRNGGAFLAGLATYVGLARCLGIDA
jgi:hypothetical protein